MRGWARINHALLPAPLGFGREKLRKNEDFRVDGVPSVRAPREICSRSTSTNDGSGFPPMEGRSRVCSPLPFLPYLFSALPDSLSCPRAPTPRSKECITESGIGRARDNPDLAEKQNSSVMKLASLAHACWLGT